MTHNLLARFISEQNYDIRLSRNGRWIDQKCAFDSVCFVADCIVEYIRSGGSQPFESPDIWRSDYAVRSVQLFFGKPDPLIRATLDEYNKFFRQPMKMLAAAGVMSEYKKGSAIQFSVNRIEILEFIAFRERNAYEFLCLYIEKTLRDSGLWDAFESFFDEQSKSSLHQLKQDFTTFCFKNTPIKTHVEANRIFIKVLNPLACKFHKKGTARGTISRLSITFNVLAYNQPNWRDVYSGKDKNVARGEFTGQVSNEQLYQYQVLRAKKNLKQFNDQYRNQKSEVVDRFSVGEIATHIHHIFPVNEFQVIADYIENLIALTSGQHLQKAHPNGRTNVIDIQYQYVCLVAKTDSIRSNLLENKGEPTIYDFEDFMYVLDVGLKTEYFRHLPRNDFNSVLQGIEVNYQ
jgi:hypothetical protein